MINTEERVYTLDGNDYTDILPSDVYFNFSAMKKFPFEEYKTWKQSDRRYNNGHGSGRGEPMPKYKIEKIIIDNQKYMTFTFYNNGRFNHKSLIITRERNKLIDNDTCKQLSQLINILSIKKEHMDYRYHRKILLQKIIHQKKNTKEETDAWTTQYNRDEWICVNCWSTKSWSVWSNELQQHVVLKQCPVCNAPRLSMEDIEKYLFENNDNEYDEKEFDIYKQRIQDIIDPLLNSEQYWIPSEFIYNKNNMKYEITHNTINNLKYTNQNNKQVYVVLGNIFTKIMPMFEWVLDKKISGMYEKLNVIISIQDYQLKPNEKYFGGVHREGYIEENVVAGAVYYFHINDDLMIGRDVFKISASLDGVCGGGDYQRVVHELNIQQGYVLVFNNNNINHALKKLCNENKNKILHRKIVVFMLVDPDKKKMVHMNVDGGKNEKDMIKENKNDINNYEDCCMLVDGYYKDLNLLDVPNVILELIVWYVVDNIKELRENRNKLRFERFLPSKSKLDLRSYGTPWIGVMN
eukprot:260248_1